MLGQYAALYLQSLVIKYLGLRVLTLRTVNSGQVGHAVQRIRMSLLSCQATAPTAFLCYFFSPAVQFVTTVRGGDAAEEPIVV
jgi:hypothetical protein